MCNNDFKKRKMFFDNVEPVVNKCFIKVKSPRKKYLHFMLRYFMCHTFCATYFNLFSSWTQNYLFIESCKKKKKDIFYRILNVILCVTNVIVKRMFDVKLNIM